MNILGALTHGYTPYIIMNTIARNYPRHATKIRNAYAAGYTAESILSVLDDSKERKVQNYLSFNEQARRQDEKNSRQGATNLLGAVGAAAGVAGGLAYLNRGRAIRPNQILPPLKNQPQGPQAPRQLPGQPPAQLGPIQPIQPRGQPPQGPVPPAPYRPTGPQPQGPNQPAGMTLNQPVQKSPNQPQVQPQMQARNPMQNVTLVKNLNEDNRFMNIIKQSQDPQTTAMILRQIIPKSKLAQLEKVEGGLEQIVNDYSQYLQTQQQPQNQQQPSQPQFQHQSQQEPIPPPDIAQTMQNEMIEREPGDESLLPDEHIHERVNETISDSSKGKQSPLPSQDMELKRQRFSIPNYHYPNEPKEDFVTRQTIYKAVNKAAKELKEGKSFLDFKNNPDIQLSTAADVLRFMAGIANPFESLLDEDEKQELASATEPETGNIYGAQMTPNLVWNLLLRIEPSLAKMKKPLAIKGAKFSPTQKMGTTELRRFLTHNVYGVLSGKSVSTELVDKINKISRATSSLDVIAKAAIDGNIRRMDEEMSKLMDDAYFLEIMNQELDNLIPQSQSFMKKKMGMEPQEIKKPRTSSPKKEKLK